MLNDPRPRCLGICNEELYAKTEKSSVSQQIISGCTCLEYDSLFTLKDRPRLDVGDRILFHNVGAYTMCLTPLFIRYIPNIYAYENNEYLLVRKKWTANEYIEKSIIK